MPFTRYWRVRQSRTAAQKALEIHQKVLGQESPFGEVLNNLALSELDLGKMQETRQMTNLGTRQPESVFPNPFVRLRGPGCLLAALRSLHALSRSMT